ncbi:MAG: penicillin-binding transpeptidase domain-containing protein [Thermodesulfobacteriota bacterium]|nr:penicillin-binding transpeptidase domain-containing protein [Thermodesulfobacteriota bacterium]
MKPPLHIWLRFRITLLLCLFSFLFLIVLARAYQLQVLRSDKLATLAERQYQRVVPLVPKRGVLYDRTKEEMAISVEVDSVFVQPAKVENLEQAAQKIGPILGKKSEFLLKKIKGEKPFIWLERGISPGQRAAIDALDIQGVDFLKEAKRFYPQGEIGAHVIGFAGMDSRGLEGVELGYDEFIRGEPGFIIISKDARGRAIAAQNPDFRRSEEGCEVILTIDRNIQYIAEKELKKAIQACSAKGGMVVVMNPKTGEILAMSVQPSFDPNRFSSYTDYLRKNRAITDTFEPGSTLKAFLLAAALEDRMAGPSEVFFCENGSFAVGGKIINDVHKHGWLSLGEIIKVSSNIGASKVGKKLGKGKLYHYLKDFGLGSKTGIDLPGEVPGFLPHPQYWSEVGLANISFGQGISLTALQLTTALSAVANGGVIMRPYIVKTVIDRQGNVLKENRPKVIRRVISPETARTAATILKTVTQEGGTGKAACLSGYETAGKTGTAQKALINGRGYSDKRIGSFVGFIPADNPQVVISVIIDEPQGVSYGGVVAAPAFKAIGEQVLPYMGVYPKGVTYLAQAAPGPNTSTHLTESDGRAPGPPARPKAEEVLEEPGIMPDFSGKSLRQVVQTAQRLGLDLKLVGSGRAVAQTPAPGQILQGDTKGMVKFQPSI